MSDENLQPVFQIQRVYLKDMSLEQPNSPAIFLEQEAPTIEVSLDVGAEAIADGALGHFQAGKQNSPLVIIELKGSDADLDHDKFNGRTPVQQCWDYLNALPACPWGIVSNFVIIRLYHRNKTPLESSGSIPPGSFSAYRSLHHSHTFPCMS